MFAVLGEIQFEVVGSPEGYESAGAYDFCEQRVIESKPRLQWVGDELERLSFELMWHSSFTNPAAQLALLRATAAQHLALPLVFGNGEFRGFFVIESIEVKSQQLRRKARRSQSESRSRSRNGSLTRTTFCGRPVRRGICTARIDVGVRWSRERCLRRRIDVRNLGVAQYRSATGASGPDLEADDVATGVIVRSVAR